MFLIGEGNFFLLSASRQPSEKINKLINQISVPRSLDLVNIIEPIVDCFDQIFISLR